jgi:hypothetical protein
MFINRWWLPALRRAIISNFQIPCSQFGEFCAYETTAFTHRVVSDPWPVRRVVFDGEQRQMLSIRPDTVAMMQKELTISSQVCMAYRGRQSTARAWTSAGTS